MIAAVVLGFTLGVAVALAGGCAWLIWQRHR